MSYIKNKLRSGEVIIFEGKPHWAMLIPHILLIFIAVGMITIIGAIIRMSTTELTITNKRIVGKTGLINTKELDTPLDKVTNVSVSSGMWGKIFGYGTIEVTSAAATYVFSGIANASSFRSTAMAQIEKFGEDKMRKQAEEMAKAMRA